MRKDEHPMGEYIWGTRQVREILAWLRKRVQVAQKR
jgi:hypothetical protein